MQENLWTERKREVLSDLLVQENVTRKSYMAAVMWVFELNRKVNEKVQCA